MTAERFEALKHEHRAGTIRHADREELFTHLLDLSEQSDQAYDDKVTEAIKHLDRAREVLDDL